MTGQRTGAEILCDVLERLGTRHVFGVPGTQNLRLFEALRRSALHTVVPTHELAAAFMAGAYSRVGGGVGVLVTIPGPGFAWAVPGLAEAALDSAAVLHITGPPASSPGSRFQLQRIDQSAIAGPLVKGVLDIERAEDVAPTVVAAWRLAAEGEPGPVLVQLHDAAAAGRCTWSGTVDGGHAVERSATVERVTRAVAVAQRPVLVAGQGCRAVANDVTALAERLGAPMVMTPSGRGVMPEDHALALCADPAWCDVGEINDLLERADLVLVLGCKLGHNGTAGFRLKLPADRTAHVDASAEVLGANYSVRDEVPARVEDVLPFLLDAAPAAREPWAGEAVAALRSGRLTRAHQPEPVVPGTGPATPAAFFEALRALLPRDAVLVADSGRHQVLARRYFEVRSPGGLLLPSDFQSMGFGIAAAIAAKLAVPNREVVALVGDGGFAMTGLELLSAEREGAKLTVIVFNDGWFGQIRDLQQAEYGRTHGVDRTALDLSAFAAAIGWECHRFARAGVEALETAIDGDRSSIVDVRVGDSWAGRTRTLKSNVRERVRGALGPRVVAWIKRRLGRGTGERA